MSGSGAEFALKLGTILLLLGMGATVVALVAPDLVNQFGFWLWLFTLATGLGLASIVVGLLASARRRSRLTGRATVKMEK